MVGTQNNRSHPGREKLAVQHQFFKGKIVRFGLQHGHKSQHVGLGLEHALLGDQEILVLDLLGQDNAICHQADIVRHDQNLVRHFPDAVGHGPDIIGKLEHGDNPVLQGDGLGGLRHNSQVNGQPQALVGQARIYRRKRLKGGTESVAIPLARPERVSSAVRSAAVRVIGAASWP